MSTCFLRCTIMRSTSLKAVASRFGCAPWAGGNHPECSAFCRRWNVCHVAVNASSIAMKKFFVCAALFLFSTIGVGAELRIANLLLSPEQKPNVEVVFAAPVNGTVSLAAPDGWRIVPAATDPKRAVFTVAQGKPNEENSYRLSVAVQRPDGSTFQHAQDVRVATAPNSNLDVVGPNEHGAATADWGHAIPCSVKIDDSVVRIHTVWNRRRLSLLVGVDNLQLAPLSAVQIALGAVRSDKAFGELYHFLLFADETGKGRLVSLNDRPNDSPQRLPEVDASKAFAWKHCETVWFEAAIPFAAIPAIRPGEGRELTLAFLIHDAAKKTVLDWGRTCLLPNETTEKWLRWQGDSIGNTVLTAPRSEWGLCSSKF